MPQFVFLVLLFTYCGVRAVNVANEWAVEVDGGIEVANIIANKFGLWNRGKIGNLDNHYHFLLLNNSSFNLTKTANDITAALESETHTKLVQHQIKRKRVKRYYTSPTDIKWSQQWSLKNTGQTDGPSGLDLNVEGAWMQGYTGEGVVVGVVDDGKN
jgi:furin